MEIIKKCLSKIKYEIWKRTIASWFFIRVKNTGNRVSFKKGLKITHGHKSIFIGSNVVLNNAILNAGDNGGYIKIDDFVFFGHSVQILARGHNYFKFGLERQKSILEKPIHIKRGAWIGSGSIILPGVTIGENSVVGAGSIITKDVPSYSVFAGNPAKLIKKIRK